MGKYMNWEMDKDCLKNYFEKQIEETLEVRIYTVLNHVSSSGMTRYISAYIPVLREGGDGRMYSDIVCIAREKKVTGCGMDMGFELAYSLFLTAYGNDENRQYQKYLRHSWM